MLTDAARFARLFELASTRRILQFGQTAWATSTSSAISSDQPASARGKGPLALPLWLTFSKHGLEALHSGSPNCLL